MAISRFSTSSLVIGNERYKAFEGAFIVDYLLIAGGGSGGIGGGGGAGGYICSVKGENSGNLSPAVSPLNVIPGVTYTITIGGGGSSVTNAGNLYICGNPGVNSSISGSGLTTITAIAGGFGGGAADTLGGQYRHGGIGGSGGGAGYNNLDGRSLATFNQGFPGGTAINRTASATPNGYSAGGGGAGSIGGFVNNSSSAAGNGGNGIASSITGTSVTRAGGGGGAVANSNTGCGSGGSGGGGAALTTSNAVAGTANTGSGGGGQGGQSSTSNTSGAGGSGVAIFRSTRPATTTTGSPTATNANGYYVYQFNGDGSITF
jgi:hypothetical protein